MHTAPLVRKQAVGEGMDFTRGSHKVSVRFERFLKGINGIRVSAQDGKNVTFHDIMPPNEVEVFPGIKVGVTYKWPEPRIAYTSPEFEKNKFEDTTKYTVYETLLRRGDKIQVRDATVTIEDIFADHAKAHFQTKEGSYPGELHYTISALYHDVKFRIFPKYNATYDRSNRRYDRIQVVVIANKDYDVSAPSLTVQR